MEQDFDRGRSYQEHHCNGGTQATSSYVMVVMAARAYTSVLNSLRYSWKKDSEL